MFKRGLLISLGVILLTAAAFAAQPCTLLFFNDFHAHFEPFKAPGQEDEVGGIARLAGLADAERAANEAAGVPTFLLVAGDAFTGTPYSSVFKGEVEFACLNAMGVDAMCLGNHEFDYGRVRLDELLATATFPVITTNVTIARSDPPQPFVKRDLWLDAGDRKMLIIGLTTPEAPVTTMPGNTAGLAFGDPKAAAAAVITVNEKQADIIVALTHIGFEEDVKLAEALPALDIIIGGHSQTKVDEVEMVGKTAVGQAFQYGEYLGRMDLVWEDDGGVTVKSYKLLPVDAAAPVNKEIAAIVDGYKGKLSERLNEVVGKAPQPLPFGDTRLKEAVVGDLVADAMREATGADAALVNGGCIRGDIDAGDVTAGEVLTALPFNNEIVVLTLEGVVLRAALDYCGREKVGAGGFLQVSGIAYTIIPGKGARDIAVNGKPLDDAASYKVAMPDFIAGGGDGYDAFKTVTDVYKSGLMLSDVVIAALRVGKHAPAAPEGRIVIEGE